MVKGLIKTLIRIYRFFISPLLPPSCRFYPSCSEYALQAVEKRGVLMGSLLGFKRLIRCHPFSEGGFDEVPPAKHFHDKREPGRQAS